MKKFTIAMILVLMLSILSFAQEKLTENTLKLSSGEKSPPATIAEMEWFAGHWTGEAFGGIADEIWSPPRSGAMMGMFRLVQKDKTVFYELMSIVDHEGSLLMRLKHFNSNLTGWEEKDKTVDFPLVAKKNQTFFFEGITFKKEGENGVTIFLANKQKDGSHTETVFRYSKTSAQQTAIKHIEKLGGTVEFDSTNQKVVKIDLHKTEITDEDLEVLKHFPELTSLDVRITKIGDGAVEYIKDLKNLKFLNLFRTNLTDKGLKELENLTELDTLLIGGTKISDEGLKHLEKMSKLRKMSVFDTPISDAGIKYLKKLNSLEILLIGKSEISKAGEIALQKALPKLSFKETMM